MAGSTWTPWSKGAERRESKADVHFILTDCFLLRFELMMQLSVCHSGRAWICYTWHGRKLCSWTKRRARIFSESSVTVFWSFSTLHISGQLKYYSLHVTGSPRASWCFRGQWSSWPTWPTRTTRVTRNIC